MSHLYLKLYIGHHIEVRAHVSAYGHGVLIARGPYPLYLLQSIYLFPSHLLSSHLLSPSCVVVTCLSHLLSSHLFSLTLVRSCDFSVLFIVFVVVFSQPPIDSRSSGPRSHCRPFSPPSPLRFVPCIFITKRFQLFPRRLASNCAYPR